VRYQGLIEAPVRKFFYIFFSVLFVGFPLLVLYWMPKLKMTLFYKKSSFNEASHAALFAPDGNVYFSRMERRPAPQSSNAASRAGVGKDFAFVEFRYMTYFHDEETDRFCTLTYGLQTNFLKELSLQHHDFTPRNTRIHIHICVYIYVYMYICIYVSAIPASIIEKHFVNSTQCLGMVCRKKSVREEWMTMEEIGLKFH
jgi:hypothetical protein